MSEVPEVAQHFSITPEGLYLCRACNFTTKKSGDLNKHVKKAHLKIKDKSCQLISELIIDQCEVKTGSSGSLRSHMQKAHQKKRGPVNECDFTANKVDGLTSKVKQEWNAIMNLRPAIFQMLMGKILHSSVSLII